MTRFFFIYFLCLCFSKIYCQNNISGRIVNKNKEPLPYCTIEILLAKDSTQIKVLSSDTLGNFSGVISNNNNILARISFIGYNDLSVLIPFDSLSNSFVSGDIVLSTNEVIIKEVEISDRKNTIEKKIDRLVFNVENTISSSGSSAYEVLSKTPLVQISGNSISIIGKGSVGVLLNDRYFYLSGEDLINYLKSIPADDIKSIEVITTPPAKYDASGGALINIITKKHTLLGTNGTISSSYTQAFYPTGQVGLNLNHRTKKTNVFGSFSYNKGSIRPMEKTNMVYLDRIFNQTEYTKRDGNSLNTSLGFEYELNFKHSISGLYSNSTNRVISLNNSNADYLQQNYFIDSTMLTNTKYNKSSSINSINLNYTGLLDSVGKKINVNANYTRYYNNRERYFSAYTDNYIQINNVSNYNNSNQLINIGTLNIDMEHPNKFLKLDYGIKLNWINNHSDNSIFNNVNSLQILDTNQSNNFIYDEKTQAGYINAYKKINKFEIQAGLRLENTTLEGFTPSSKGKINTVNRIYFNLFPTAYFLYNINDNNILSFSYDRRIDRPAYNALNPFRFYSTPYIYSEGNPYLKPTYYNTIDLSYTLKQNYVLGVSYFSMINSYSDVPTQVNQNYLAYLQENIGNTYQYSAYCIIPVNIGKHIESTFSFNYTNSNYITSLSNFNGSTRGIFVTNINCQFFWGKENRFRGEISSNLRPFGSTYAITKMGHQNVVNVAIKMSVLKKRGSVSFGVNDIFFESTPTSQVNAQNIIIYINNRYDTRNFRVSFSYKFGYKGLKKAKVVDTGNTDETNRIKGFK